MIKLDNYSFDYRKWKPSPLLLWINKKERKLSFSDWTECMFHKGGAAWKSKSMLVEEKPNDDMTINSENEWLDEIMEMIKWTF